MTKEPTITAQGVKDEYPVTVKFVAVDGTFNFPEIESIFVPGKLIAMWKKKLFDMAVDPNLYSVVPRIPPFGSVERVETMLSRFFGVNDEGKINATVKYENCEPYQDEEELNEQTDMVY